MLAPQDVYLIRANYLLCLRQEKSALNFLLKNCLFPDHEPPKIKCPEPKVKVAEPGRLTARVSWNRPHTSDTSGKTLEYAWRIDTISLQSNSVPARLIKLMPVCSFSVAA